MSEYLSKVEEREQQRRQQRDERMAREALLTLEALEREEQEQAEAEAALREGGDGSKLLAYRNHPINPSSHIVTHLVITECVMVFSSHSSIFVVVQPVKT